MEEKNLTKILIAAIVVLGLLFVYNTYKISAISNGTNSATGAAVTGVVKSNSLPTGIPKIYGQELEVSYDDPVKSMDILNLFDDLQDGSTRGTKPITLSSNLEARYIKIGMSIGCEFCCGAKALIDKSGKPACGCAHSGAMRGLAKYLLQNHANEFSDQDILNELVKWKTLFFPKQMLAGNQLPAQVGGC